MLITKVHGNRHARSGEDFLKGFYHIWAWQASWSCDHYHINKFSFLCTLNLTFKILLKMAQWFLRKASFNFHV